MDLQKVRVFVVDDSVVIRRVLCDVLSTDPALEVAGTAENGVQALAKIPQLNPDLITLDIEMPELDGLATLTALRKQFPRLPVIMFSTLTQRGAVATIDALTRGASDYVSKPSNVGSLAEARQTVRDQLIPKIKSLCQRQVPGSRPGLPLSVPAVSPSSGVRALGPAPASGIRTLRPASGVRTLGPTSGLRTLGPAPASSVRAPAPSGLRTLPPMASRAGTRRVDAVVIGISTGGPNALAKLLPSFPAEFPVPVLIVQHMPPTFTALLAERLTKVSRIPVKEAAGGEHLGPCQAWIAPGGFHLEVASAKPGWTLKLQTDAAENSCRPAADVLFRSAAAIFGPTALAVVMTGMGQDGQKGCEAIRAAGGQVLAQDEATSVVWGMPGSVVRAGLVDKVLPLEQLGNEIIRRVRVGRESA